MAVIPGTVKLAFAGSVGSVGTEKVEYEAVYLLNTNNPLDQAAVVINYFRDTPTLPYLGSVYSYGNDDDSSAQCVKVTARRRGKDAVSWYVTLSYASEDPAAAEMVDMDGNPTTEPLDMRPQLKVVTVPKSKAVAKAIYRGGFVGGAAAKINDGDERPPQNSAGVVFNPPLEKDNSLTVITITRNQDHVSGDLIEVDKDVVNSAAFEINYLGYTHRVRKLTAKITQQEASMTRTHVERTIGGNKVRVPVDYWEHSKEMTIDPDGWRDEVVDRGVHARADAGDPDGKGGSISFSDLRDGVPRVRRLTDVDDHPITEPVLLNGDGQPLQDPLGAPVYIIWQKYRETDFRFNEFFQGIIS